MIKKHVIVFGIFMTLLLPRVCYSDQTFKFIEATGRAVIQEDKTVTDARRIALEDAIFLAAIHGGAQVNGFSSINKETTLSDHFTVQPAGKILDFNIINEAINGEHYEISIKAAVGTLSSRQCAIRSTSAITKFSPKLIFSDKVPAWLHELARQVDYTVTKVLSDSKKFVLTNETNVKFDAGKLLRTDDEYNYSALTTGKVRVQNGDFAYQPEIRITITESKKNIENEIFMTFELTSRLFHGASYKLAAETTFQTIVKLRSSTPFRSLDILGKKTNDQVSKSVLSGVNNHVQDLIGKLNCIPLSAKLKLDNGELTIDLGHRHGVSTNSLAVSTGTNTPYTILHVTRTSENRSTLEPLNTSIEAKSLLGKKIEFMEPIK
jgi:hypothetical protein